MNQPTSTRRRPLPSKTLHLQAQAAMPGTLNGDAAARELAQTGQPISPTAPAVEPTPSATSASVAEPIPEPVAEVGASPTALAPAAEPTPTAALPAPTSSADVTASTTTRTTRSKTKGTGPAKAEKQGESASPGGSTRLSKDHLHDIKAAQLHFLLVHDTAISLQDFVGDALDHYLAHLRKTGKLPPAKS